jgi:hypothetical protein
VPQISRASLTQQMQQLRAAAQSATSRDQGDVVVVKDVPDQYRAAVEELAAGSPTVTLNQLDHAIAQVEKAAATADGDRWLDGLPLGQNFKRLLGGGGLDDGQLNAPELSLAHALASGGRVAHLLQTALTLASADAPATVADKPRRVSAQQMPRSFRGADELDDNVAALGLAKSDGRDDLWDVTVSTGGMIGGAKTFSGRQHGDNIIGSFTGDYGESILVSISMLEGRHVAELVVTEIEGERSYSFDLVPED